MAVRKRRRRARRKRRQGWLRRWRWWLLGAGVVALGLGLSWVLWPYWQMPDRFGAHAGRRPSRLYGHSEVLRAGESYGRERLAEELERLDYRRIAASPGSGEYAIDANRVLVRLRAFPTPWGWNRGGPLEVVFAGSRIGRLVWRGAEVDRVLLEPALLASFAGPDQGERRPVALDDVPEQLVHAVLAAEDATFFRHPGLSLRGIARAFWVNLREREVAQGGSTLTQQLVKNLFLTHERTLARKVREASLAVLVDLRRSKPAILEAYLNEIYWGRSGQANLMGVGAASWAYFGKEVSQLDLCESALLAGLIRSPGDYSPRHHPERAVARRDWVLGRMAELGWLEPERLERARAAPLCYSPHRVVTRRAPYFLGHAVGEAVERFRVGELADAGYSLLSTLDWGAQQAAEEAVAWGLPELEKSYERSRRPAAPLQAALVSLEPSSGAVRAWVGGRDYQASQYDRVALARRQPGSAFKPIVHAAAYEHRAATPATLLEDTPLTVVLAGAPEWSPRNSDGDFRGMVTARTALEESLNVPTARLALHVGLGPIIETARALGLRGRLDTVPSLALGAFEVTPLELAGAYAAFANGGRRPGVHFLDAVLGPDGEPLRGPAPPAAEPALDPATAYLVVSLMEGVVERGTAAAARRYGVSDRVAGKTGTSNDRRDSWFAGVTPDRATLVWVGYDDNSPTRLSGARGALPIWARFAAAVRPPGGYPRFRQPAGVTTALIDPLSGGLATDLCPRLLTEVFRAGSEPDRICHLHGDWRWQPEIAADEELGRRVKKRRGWLRRIFGKRRDGERRP